MKTVLNLLYEKLNTLGYNETIVNSTISKLDLSLVENASVGAENLEDFISVIEYTEPSVEVTRTFLNICNDIIQCNVVEGDIHAEAAESAVGSRFVTANYSLSKRNVIIAITSELKIKILVYNPLQKVQILYNEMTYEQAFKKERDSVALSYYEAFESSVTRTGKTSDRKVKEIIALLTADFVIDEIAINDLNPKFKMYDNEYKFAENIYSHSIRYINLRTNRIEFIEKNANIKMISKNVQPGIISNDPYIKIDKKLQEVDFPLNEVSYYWIYASKGIPEQIAIFLSSQTSEKTMFSELKEEDQRIDNLARDIARKFRKEESAEIDYIEIKNILKKLNFELMFPSVDFIRLNMSNKTDSIEPIKYKYRVITDPAEFESELYITIEDHVARRYKYKLVETINDDLTTVGNKLEYTSESGESVRKQSVADFNVNSFTAIISRETFIGAEGIPDLLGYIYQDMPYLGTDALPVPNIEIIFYIPAVKYGGSSITMYNGTSLEYSIANITNQNFYSEEQRAETSTYVIGGKSVLPGSTTVTVKYLNSNNEILKENTIANVFPKATYTPDIIPVINDKEGKEWIVEENAVSSIVLSSIKEENVVEIKYNPKYSRVKFSYISREGKKLAEEKQELIQVGTNYDFSSKAICKDSSGDEWKLVNLRPAKLIVSENEENNKVMLVYDIERADVVISYMTKAGVTIAPDKTLQTPIDKLYRAEVISYIVDSEGLGWNYLESSNPTVEVKKTQENKITLLYEEAKQKVVIRAKDKEGNPLINDDVNFEQIGKTYTNKFDDEIIDLDCKEWKISRVVNDSVKVDADPNKNIIEAIYEPKLSKVAILFVGENGLQIREQMVSEIQIGAKITADSLGEITDSFGKVWTCTEKEKSIVVSSREKENKITLKYKPLMGKVTLKYFDTESKELIPSKYEEFQVGTSYKNKPIQKMTDEQGRHWIIDEEKVPTIVVKKYDEENIVSIYYDKECAKAQISFVDVYGNKLREPQEFDAQIGAPFEDKSLLKITDTEGFKWMLESTEPKNIVIREKGNSFKFIYGEVKAKVLVKHVNIETKKTIIEDTILTVKLGGIYAPNIRKKVLDKNKWSWKYVGEENISIVTKENEQENIITLDYEEDKSNVILKFKNINGEEIRSDAVKQVQIGKEIKIEHIEKVNDNNGLGWKFSKTTLGVQNVKEEDNIIEDTYEPLMADVIVKYFSDSKEEIQKQKNDKIQVGKKYTLEIIDRIKDGKGALWKFANVKEKEIIVKEGTNDFNCAYEKVLSDVTVNLLSENGSKIVDSIVNKYQVGTTFNHDISKSIEDKEGKSWIFDKIDFEAIEVNEEAEKNVVNVTYKKELVNVKLCYFDSALQTIKEPDVIKAQIGSIYIADSARNSILFDKTNLGWEIREDLIPKYKVKRNPEENVVNISYDKYLVDTITEFVDEKGGKIKDSVIEKCQVGTKYIPKIEDYIEDSEGKEWIYAESKENKMFTLSKKLEPITVTESVGKNVISLRYKPSLIKLKIRYIDPLGTEIRKTEIVEAQIGSIYKAEIIENIIGVNKVKWAYNTNSKSSIKIANDESKNVINLAYEEEKSAVIHKYYDEDHNVLKEDKKTLAQIGSSYKIVAENIIEGQDGRVWEYKAKSHDKIDVDEDDSKNIVEIIYSPLYVDVALKIVTLNGNSIMKNKIVKAQLGSDFKAPVEIDLTDEESRLYRYVKVKPDTLKIREIPIGREVAEINAFEVTYESVYAETRIIFKDVDGNKIKEDALKQMHVGTMFAPDPIQYITDAKGIQWEIIDQKINPVRVMEDGRLNVISMTYEVAKAEVLVRYKDADGNLIKEADRFKLEIGSEFVPKVEKELEDSEKKKWIYMMTDPIKLTVGSINNIVNVVYQEKRATATVRIQATDGRELKSELISKEQIGSKFRPAPKIKVLYDNSNNIYRYAFNSPEEIIISENPDENIIIQYYTTDENYKPQEEKKEEKPKLEVEERFIDKELIAQMEKEEEEKRKKEEEEAKKLAEMPKEEVVEFTDTYLQVLDRSIKLTNSQRKVINKLNDYNTQVVSILREAAEFNGTLESYDLRGKLDKIIREEKEYVTTGLADMIAEDKTGNKILKIFEAITSSEMSDKNFNMLQQKKAIVFTDYFVNRGVTDIKEEISYIIARGKNDKEIECVNEKMQNAKNGEELKLLKIRLIYESIMLDNYYRARTIAKDEYFKDEASKEKVSRDVMIGVVNALPTQTLRLFEKAINLSFTEKNELEAILKLLNSQQLSTVQNSINKISDGKLRKMALKLYKELVK